MLDRMENIRNREVPFSLIALWVVIAVMGCGKSGPPIPPPTPNMSVMKDTSVDAIKARLDGIEKAGNVGSALAGMKEAIEKLPPEKSGPLLKDLTELQQALKADKVKEIAKRMISKL